MSLKLLGADRVSGCVDFTNMATLEIEMSNFKHFFLYLKQ